MRTRYDQFSKQLLREALAPSGNLETDTEVSPDAQRIDVWYVPHPEATHAARRSAFGLLSTLAQTACLLEPFHQPPDVYELLSCLRKHLGHRHAQQRRGAEPEPWLWILSSGSPHSAMRALEFRRSRALPRGVYVAAPALRCGLVVISSLPERRDTLLLRLMGGRRVFRRAIVELDRLREDAPERRVAMPALLRLMSEIPADPVLRTADDAEFLMSTEDIVETWKQKAIAEGIEKGTVRGLVQGLVELYGARFGSVPEEVRALLDRVTDDRLLRAWFERFASASPIEIMDLLRSNAPR